MPSTGRFHTFEHTRKESSPVMIALSFRDVSFEYNSGQPVVRDVSFDVPRGEVLAIVGPNGSGKSTLLKLGARLLSPRQGSVEVFGRTVSGYPRLELARLLAVVPQDGSIFFPFTVEEVVLMGRAPHGTGRAFERKEDHRIVRDAMERTDILHLARQPVTRLSGGERQRVLIARALAQEPQVLLLDEPNAHLDIAHQVEIFNLMKQMNAESGLTVVAVSHDLNLASSYASRIAVLREGRLFAIGEPGSVFTEETIQEVFQTSVLVDTHPLHLTPRVTLNKKTGRSARPVVSPEHERYSS